MSKLEELLKKSAARPMTAEERFEQKVSWVYGQLQDCNPEVTKDQVRQRLRENQ